MLHIPQVQLTSLNHLSVVGTGTGKILKGAGQGIGHAFGGGKWCHRLRVFILFDFRLTCWWLHSSRWRRSSWKGHWEGNHERRRKGCSRRVSPRCHDCQ